MAVARNLPDVELVSIDSMQVYRGMDIGTAKPSTTERNEVAHHLLDVVEPTHDFTVAEFRDAYAGVLDDLAARQRRALLVGGTGLYHRVVVDEFDLPGAWPDIRAELDAQDDVAALFEQLRRLDPVGAAKMEPTNQRRIVRALEVTLGSGRPFSSFGPGVDNYPLSPVEQIGVRWPREVIRRRIADRVHQMIADGLEDEVASLSSVGLSRSARQALGYKEMLAAIDGTISKDEAINSIITRTQRFAVRQERWFRRDPRVRWIDVEHDPVAEATPVVLAAFAT